MHWLAKYGHHCGYFCRAVQPASLPKTLPLQAFALQRYEKMCEYANKMLHCGAIYAMALR